MTLQEAIDKIIPLDEEAMKYTRARWNTLGKPLYSLGRLEEMVISFAGIYRDKKPKIGKKAVSLKFTVSKREDVDTGVAGVELGCASLTGMLAANKRIDSSVNGGGACLYQNLWLRADAGALDLPMGLAGVDCSMIFNVKNRLSMRFGANGSVICTAVMSNGTSTASTSVILVRKESVDKWIGNVVVSIPSRTVKSGKKTVTVAGLHIIVPIEVTSPTIPAGAPGILVGGEGAVYYDFGDGEYLVEQP